MVNKVIETGVGIRVDHLHTLNTPMRLFYKTDKQDTVGFRIFKISNEDTRLVEKAPTIAGTETLVWCKEAYPAFPSIDGEQIVEHFVVISKEELARGVPIAFDPYYDNNDVYEALDNLATKFHINANGYIGITGNLAKDEAGADIAVALADVDVSRFKGTTKANTMEQTFDFQGSLQSGSLNLKIKKYTNLVVCLVGKTL